MSLASPDLQVSVRGKSWRWWVCGLLLLATMINYMDRLTLNLLAVHIRADLHLDAFDYGMIEWGFGLGFAAGAVLFGFLVDRFNPFWVYPAALVFWSLAGLFTGFAQSFAFLLTFRVLLGVVEAANWPCALRTTQRILPPGERSMGNSILQSGAALGAILMPVVLFLLFDKHRISTWRIPFFVVGAAGIVWVFLWAVVVRPADLALSHQGSGDISLANAGPALPRAVFIRRFVVLIVMVVSINMTWHFLRSWLPTYLAEKYDFDQDQTNLFTMAYYTFTDLGALTAGFLSLRLVRRGMAVHSSRRLVFLGAALLTTLCLIVPLLHSTWVVVGTLLLIGFGALGVFPCYYSFSQDLTTRHQGKVTGLLGACCWVSVAFWQLGIGAVVRWTGSYVVPFVISGLIPMGAFVVLLLFWGKVEEPTPVIPVEGPLPAPGQPATEETRVLAASMAAQPDPARNGPGTSPLPAG